MRYFDKVKKSSGPSGTQGKAKGDLRVFEGALAAEPKRKRVRHLVERKRHKDHLHKLADLSKSDVKKELLESKQGILTNKNKIKKEKEESDRLEIPKEVLVKYSKGTGFEGSGVKTDLGKKKLLQKEKVVQWASEQAARAEILQLGDSGLIEADDGETTRQYRQDEICKNVDITSAAKRFELQLRQFGPYRMDFTRNGRNLVIGGRKGHVAAFDWITKKLMFEINVMEDVIDVKWLHNETMVATAQKEWVFIYDKIGTELHCLKLMNRVIYLEFLPYHFLLTSINEDGRLSWLDTSIGEMVAQTNAKVGRPSCMTQNPHNAVICVGNSKGVVSMWSPTVKGPLAKMLCHKTMVQGIAIDHRGVYMATSAPDCSLKIWDIRKLDGPLQKYQLHSNATHLSFSQKGLLATALGNIVEVYNDCCSETASKPYLKHCMKDTVSDLNFCPYEDVLGIGTRGGYQSILVPGSGEPNFDAFEANPFETKSQRRETEVKSLLDKIKPEMIALDPQSILEVDVPTLKDKIEAKKQLLFIKPPKIDFTPRVKKKKHGNTVRMARSKKIVRAEAKQEFLKAMKQYQPETHNEDEDADREFNVLDRFREKKRRK